MRIFSPVYTSIWVLCRTRHGLQARGEVTARTHTQKIFGGTFFSHPVNNAAMSLLLLCTIVEPKQLSIVKAKYLLYGLAAYVGIKFFSKKIAAEKLNYFVQKVSLRFSGFTPILDVILGIQNPTGEALSIGSIVGELFINGNYIANISGFQLTQIKPMAATLFPLSARLSISGLIGEAKDIVDAISTGSTSVLLNQTLKFNGNVYAEGVTLPLSFSYKVL